MTTNAEKKARQKANREARLERAVREEEQRRQRQRLLAIAVLVAAVVLIIGIVVMVSGDDGSEDPVPDATDTTEQSEEANTPVAPECPPDEGAETRTIAFTEAPPTCIDPAKSYTAEVTTSKGAFTIALNTEAAPETVNNFVFLARHRFYDGIPFHRVVEDFVIQAGDPTPAESVEDLTQLGGGGPGYQIDDELSAAESGGYKTMSVAMANSGPNTNGSQFFVVLEGGGTQLQPLYSLFGDVTEGADVVNAIGSVPVDGQAPTELVRIESVRITESGE